MRFNHRGFHLAGRLIVLGGFGWILYSIVRPPIYYCDPRRDKISRAKSDMRTLATAIESYNVDFGEFPPPLRLAARHQVDLLAPSRATRLSTLGPSLTTPIAYVSASTLTSPDPFSGYRTRPTGQSLSSSPRKVGWSFAYARFGASGAKEHGSNPGTKGEKKNAGWILWSPGIDGIYDLTDPASAYDPGAEDPTAGLAPYTWDPTNGIESRGDIWRVHVPLPTAK